MHYLGKAQPLIKGSAVSSARFGCYRHKRQARMGSFPLMVLVKGLAEEA
jgi:hypothetical protein